MEEIYKLNKKEKEMLEKSLKEELSKAYSDEEAEVIIKEVLESRGKVQKARKEMEKAEKVYWETIREFEEITKKHKVSIVKFSKTRLNMHEKLHKEPFLKAIMVDINNESSQGYQIKEWE